VTNVPKKTSSVTRTHMAEFRESNFDREMHALAHIPVCGGFAV